MFAQTPVPPTWLDSRLADTAPALVGVALLLCIILAFVLRMLGRVGSIADRQAGAVEKLAGSVDRLKDRDDAREDRHFDVLRTLGEACQTAHVAQHVKLDAIAEATRRIEDRLGKAKGPQ